MTNGNSLGFIGLGVMGGPMCRNLARKSGAAVFAFVKSLLPDIHPTEGAFPTRYILKDLSYAIGLAESCGLTLEQAATTRRLLDRTAALGWRDAYYTAVIRAIEQPRA
jgi:3-hydroxyisobutyrate dehydrogenase-like beta-hydroxyacid dehydrogenase